MKKGVFNIWLKELCSLVFTQTVQAFLLAIIMSIVLSVFSDGEQTQASMSAAGVIAIIALASISKIELLIKKIFGIESQFGDPSMANGMKSVAGGILAAKSIGKIANNVPKMVTGFRESRGAKKDAARAQQRFAKRLSMMNEYMSAGDSQDLAGQGGGETSTYTSANTSTNPNGQNADSIVTGAGKQNTPGAQGKDTGSTTNNANLASATAKAKKADVRYREKLLDIQEKYEEEMSKANKRRSEGRRKIVSGISESIGAVGGAAAGFAVGAGSGDISKGLAYGIGAGDTIGKNIVSAGYNVKEFVQEGKSVGKADRAAINEMRKLLEGNDAILETRSPKVPVGRRARELRKEKAELIRKVGEKMDSMMDAGKL